MISINPGFDAERERLLVFFKVGFLDKYYNNLQGLLLGENNKNILPEGIELKKIGKNEVEISFNPPEKITKQIGGSGYGSISVSDPNGYISNLHKVITKFVESGMKKELSTTEFIPLRGYPEEDLVKDIKESMKNKRNLCLIRDYSEYLQSQEIKIYKFNQYRVNYGTNEWADICLDFIDPKFSLEKVEKKYLPLLKEEDWL